MSTTIIFGDVHGEAGKLRTLIDNARARWGDLKLYGLGDYIDRGKDSKGVIQICVDEGVEGILGNHELWFHKLLNLGQFDDGALHPVMGGRATLDSYKLGVRWPEKNVARGNVPESHQEFILSLPVHRTIEVAGTQYWLIHAGIGEAIGDALLKDLRSRCDELGIPVVDDFIVEVCAEVKPDEMLWNHINPKAPQVHRLPAGGVQVMGHTPLAAPIDGGHFIALDTGCGRKKGTKTRPNCLSAVALHDDGTRTFLSSDD